MTSLESIVLPLEQSRVLVEKGIVLETALMWVQNLPELRWRVTIFPTKSCIPAPVLSELLDAIRARHPDADYEFVPEKQVHGFMWYGGTMTRSGGKYTKVAAPTDLLAACALLMEVSK